MRFLVDASVSPVVANGLREAGHDAVHVGDALRLDASDPEILAHAVEHDRVIVAADTDFGQLLALGQGEKPSVILFRRRTSRRPSEQLTLLLDQLPDVVGHLDEGAIVVIEDRRLRVRRLPLHP